MYRNIILSIASILVLSGCGSGGGSSSNSSSSNTGTFIDDVVAGVKYVNGTNTGYTDSKGQFPYNDGLVEFFVGNIKIGELNSLPSDNKVFIQDLVLGEGNRTNTSDADVLKIACFLQTLDSDNTTDEIELTQSDFDKFNLTNDSIDNIDINTVLTNAGFTNIRNNTDAKRHLDNALKYNGLLEDTTSPELSSSSISNSDSNISIDSNIVLTFSDDVRRNNINKNTIILKDSNDNIIDFDITRNFNIITINPKRDFANSSSYTLVVKTNIEDYGKNKLTKGGENSDITISFTTAALDTQSPVLSSTTQTYITTAGTALTLQIVTANDTEDGAITVVQSGDIVDFDTVGTYAVVYTATDGSGNTSNITHTYKVIKKVIVLKTGQTTSYTDYDDGYYQKGASRSYTRGGDIVIDQITKLQWQDDIDAKNITKTWEEAKTYCEDKNLGGHNDWKLPTIKELQTIVDDGKYNPSMNIIFENTSSNFYWSSTTDASNTSDAWLVNFYRGSTNYHTKTYTLYVRCVRAGQ